MRRNPSTVVTALVLAALAAGCGPKRPPAVTAAPPPAAETERPAAPRERLDTGGDLQPLSDEGPTGEDLALSDASGEGGPLADIPFDYDEAALTDEARATLEKHALWLQTQRDTRIAVEGHCDERGTVEYNLALGDQRARAARDYLVSLGVAPERLRTVSFGKERPLDPGHDEAAWARNRRAHFAVSRR